MKCRVLMLGPELSVKGGITTVEQFYLDNWDENSNYELRHVGTFVDSSKLSKVLTFIKAFFQYCYLLCFWRPNIVHIHFSWKASFYRKAIFVILSKFFRVKIVLHCHASRFHLFYENGSQINRNLICWILNYADKILVVSQQWLEYFTKLPIESSVQLLYNPVVCSVNLGNIAEKKPVILTLGHLGERKGTYDTLKAVPLVLKEFPNAEFWLGGDGDIEKLRTILAAEPWGERVRLLGWIGGEDKEKIFAQASIFLLPSYNEGLPVAILEAMAYGLPIISTPVGGIPEAVLEGENGFLVQPGDWMAIANKIELLFRNPELCNQMGCTARQYAMEKFEIRAILQQLLQTYDTLKPN